VVDSVNGGSGTADTVQIANNGGAAFTIAQADVLTRLTAVESITAAPTNQIISITLDDSQSAVLTKIDLVGDTTATANNVIDVSDETSAAYTLGGSAGIDTITGGAGADIISGNGGADIINGGGGADIITGGAAVDAMTGAAGADIFVIADADSGITVAAADVIADFTTADDSIDFSGAAGTGANYAEANGTGNANLAAVITDADAAFNGTVLYYFEYNVNNGGDGYLLFDADGDGSFNNTDVLVILTGANLATEFGEADIVA
jgi:Ca2+-binding RTX toxin-like protein